MSIATGALVPLTIDKPAAGGRMIARVDGQIVLVAGAIPGERVVARVERVAKGVVYAGVTAIEHASPDRREGVADPLCGGCLYNHIAYPRQLEIKSQVVADAFARIARIQLPGAVSVAASREDGYRMRARLHLRGGRIGFFREGTHELCDARATRQLLPEAVDALERVAGGYRLPSGEVELSENVPGTERAIAVDGEIALGEPYVHETLAIEGRDVSFRRHILAFFQGNRYLLRSLVAHVVSLVSEGQRVVDLYAGSGLFSVPVSIVRGAHVTAVEGDRQAAGDLEWNSREARGARIEARHESVETFAMAHGKLAPDVLIVDPPRTGMSREAIAGVVRLEAARVVYVSCDMATLARDARRLADAGYSLARVDAFDMFPNTPHVEAVAVFSRA